MAERGRAAAMADRVAGSAGRAGLDARALDRIGEALHAAMAPRIASLDDEHHPAFLHPARTVLILLEDAGLADADALAAAACCETLDAPLGGTLPAGEVPRALLAAVPRPGGPPERLLDALLAADTIPRTIALAERLDHARHLHLRPDLPAAQLHAETAAAYLPAAERTHAVLHRRLAWWCRMFGRRLERGG